jgi:hypothetical protein
MNQEECCPKFEPEPWDGKILEWNGKKFIKEKVLTLFYMPVNFGGVMKKLMNKLDSANTGCVDNMGLSDHTSKWNMDIYLAVDKEVPDAKNVTLSGKYLSKVYEGDFKETGKWCKDFEVYAKSRNLSVQKWFMWYTTCPKCAKKHGKNYVAIIGKVD